MLVMPLAKGYAAQNPYRINREIIADAEAALIDYKALTALDALPAEPADAGEMVEVRACVALQPDGRWNWIGFGNALGPANDETLAEYALDFGAGNAKVAAFTTARIPRPVVPEVRAEVET